MAKYIDDQFGRQQIVCINAIIYSTLFYLLRDILLALFNKILSFYSSKQEKYWKSNKQRIATGYFLHRKDRNIKYSNSSIIIKYTNICKTIASRPPLEITIRHVKPIVTKTKKLRGSHQPWSMNKMQYITKGLFDIILATTVEKSFFLIY